METDYKQDVLNLLSGVENFFSSQKSIYGENIFLDYDFSSLQLTNTEKKRKKLYDLFFQIRNCQNCELSKHRKRLVFGSGDPDSRILLIGEAPGVNEDLLGKPFVGEAGKLLDKILAAINLTRNDVFITNVIKCHPPGNRDPLPHERSECEIILKRQIEILRAEFILILGRVAAHSVLKTNKPLGELRGKVVNVFDAQAVVTYHPAALLRDASLKRSTWEDVQLFQNLLK